MFLKCARKLINIIIPAFLIFSILSLSTSALAIPYTSYTYDSSGNPLVAPNPYLFSEYINGESLGIEDFSEPSDLCFNADKSRLYILDSGHGRVIVLDKDFKLITDKRAFSTAHGTTETLSKPKGFSLDKNGFLYIADSDNGRIVKMTSDLEVTQIYTIDLTSTSALASLDEGFVFSPQKIAVDKAGNMYIVSTGVNQGLMEFTSDGKFTGFLGAPKVVFNFTDYVWRLFSTEEQLKRQQQFVPTEFSNVVCDDEGFLFGTISTIDTAKQAAAFSSGDFESHNPVKRFSANGVDILVRNGVVPPYGDLIYNNDDTSYQGASYIVDIAVDENGVYSLLDNKRGRIFTYDSDGNLLHIFGGFGSQKGTFVLPVAIEKNTDNMFILDKQSGAISIFKRNEYAVAMDEAIHLFDSGEYAGSVEKWKEVVKLNSNYTPAYIGIGKNHLRNNEYKEALEYLNLGEELEYQSKAFGYYRDELLYQNIIYLFTIAGVFVLAVVVAKFIKKKRLVSGVESETEKNKYPQTLLGNLRFSFYLIFHPFKGFWELKHERRNKTKPALIILALLMVSFVVNSLYRGVFAVPVKPEFYSLASDIARAVLPVLLWCVSSWCFTSLMDGKETFADIFNAVCYSVSPLAIVYIPLTIISNFLQLEEIALYSAVISFAMFWTVVLIVIGTMVTNDYSMKKTILTCILTLVGIAVILFLALVMFSIIQQVILFVVSIYRELSFRS